MKIYVRIFHFVSLQSRLATEEEMMVYHTKELIDILEKSQFLPLEEMRKLSRLYDYLYFHKVNSLIR